MNILIIGAGTIGKGFIKYLIDKNTITVIDNNEWAIAELKHEYNNRIFTNIDDYISITDNHIIFPIDVIIHTAAYKHVELGEENSIAFVENNITKLIELVKWWNYRRVLLKEDIRFLFISTDKAVEPISLYGFTKAIGELIVKAYGGYIVRLGNILSSSGSVIPVWEKAIEEKKPLPITNWDMKRYVIDVENAISQIWELFLKGEKLIIPKCEKITVKKLFEKVLSKHNLSTYPVKIIGERAGEKMEEKLRWDYEKRIII